jgi:SAM-dependent methyltransferase
MNLPTGLKRNILKWCWPLMPGWPDEGRRIVQGPHLRGLLAKATNGTGQFPRVFNAGAGEGGYSPLLLALPGIQTLVESDYDFGSKNPNRIDPRQVFFAASLVWIPLGDKSVNLVLCTEVLEHIEEHEQALDEITRVMADGGWLVITVPTPPAPPDANHVREGYRPEELAGMLEKRGFRIVESRLCMRFFFRFVLANWWKVKPWCPRIAIRTLSYFDRVLPIGPPMDLMILAQLHNHAQE